MRETATEVLLPHRAFTSEEIQNLSLPGRDAGEGILQDQESRGGDP